MDSTTTGILLLVVAGVMNASFTLPMKFTRKWAWENTWLAWTLFALVVLPGLVTLMTVPNLGQVYGSAGAGIIAVVAAFGLGWGVAQVLFGLAVNAIGIALTFSIVLGISAALGSIIPMIQLHRDKIFSTAGAFVFAGVVLVIAGVAVCAIAGRKREAAQGANTSSTSMSFASGLTIAIVSGLLAAFMNFGVAFGEPLMRAARQNGASAEWSVNTVWVPLMLAGAIPNLLYCVYLLRRNATGKNFGVNGTGGYWGLAALMAFFWLASTMMYGVASGKLGELGAVVGWPFFMSLIVITASVLGAATGEWKNTGKQPLRIMMAGVAILIVAVVVLSRVNNYM